MDGGGGGGGVQDTTDLPETGTIVTTRINWKAGGLGAARLCAFIYIYVHRLMCAFIYIYVHRFKANGSQAEMLTDQ